VNTPNLTVTWVYLHLRCCVPSNAWTAGRKTTARHLETVHPWMQESAGSSPPHGPGDSR